MRWNIAFPSHLHCVIRGFSVLNSCFCLWGTAVAQWLMYCATNRKFAGSIPDGVIGFFVDIKSFRSHYGPGVESAFKQKWVPGAFLGGKGCRCVRLTNLPPSCAVVTKSGDLDFLVPSGPLRASNGTDLLLRFWFMGAANLLSDPFSWLQSHGIFLY